MNANTIWTWLRGEGRSFSKTTHTCFLLNTNTKKEKGKEYKLLPKRRRNFSIFIFRKKTFHAHHRPIFRGVKTIFWAKVVSEVPLKCKWTKPTFCRIGEKALWIAIRPKRDAAHGFGNFWRDRTGYWRGRRRVYGFPMDLVDYVKRTWVNGKFSVQDWNIFDVGKLSTKILHRIIISKSCPKFCKFGDNFLLLTKSQKWRFLYLNNNW